MRRTIFALAAAVTAAGAASAAPVQWTVASGGNGHWYEFVTTGTTWDGARTAAAGMSHMGMGGYLATITSADEQAFLNSIYSPNYGNPWLGGSDADTEGTWKWMTGPEAGTTFWQSGTGTVTFAYWGPGEPNNQGDEDYLHGWFHGNLWNDIPGSWNYYYLVEYSGTRVSTVPVPAALPLLLSALGLGAVAARRRRS